MKWEVLIKRVDNGYIIVPLNGEGGELVVETKDGESHLGIKEEQLALREVFYHLKDYFGVFNDKHNNQYLEISVSGDDE